MFDGGMVELKWSLHDVYLNSINCLYCNFLICCHPFQNQRVEEEICSDSPMIEIEPLNEIATPSPLPTLRFVYFLSYIVSMAV